MSHSLPIAVSRVTGAADITMTTVEIAELTGTEHKHVLRNARLMLDAFGVRSDQF